MDSHTQNADVPGTESTPLVSFSSDFQLPPGSPVNGLMVQDLDKFLRYCENPARICNVLLKLHLVFTEQKGSLFGYSTDEVNELMFLVKLLEDWQAHRTPTA